MKIKRIFIDIDDVLNHFTLNALRHVGCNISVSHPERYDPEWGFDIVRAANALHSTNMFTLKTFWKEFDRKFWVSLPLSISGSRILTLCEHLVGRENICLLSAPIDDPECSAGKHEWIKERLPDWLHKQFLIGPCKHFCGQAPSSLLIDDSDANVNDFRTAGGQAILYPQPWNTMHKFTGFPVAESLFVSLLNNGPPEAV